MISELIAILTIAKEAGFEVGSMITLTAIYMRLEYAAKKRDKAMVERSDKMFAELMSKFDTHNNANEKRFTRIETHIGLTKGE